MVLIIAEAKVVFPQPDSPANPIDWPFFKVKLISFNA